MSVHDLVPSLRLRFGIVRTEQAIKDHSRDFVLSALDDELSRPFMMAASGKPGLEPAAQASFGSGSPGHLVSATSGLP